MLLWLLAQSIEDYQKQLDQINQLIIENRQKLEELKREEKSILYELSILQSRIELYNQKLDLLRRNIQKLSDEIYVLNIKKKAILEEIEKTKDKLSKSARLLYKLPKNNMWELILRTGSFYESYKTEVSLMSILKYYKALADNLREKQKEFENIENQINKNLQFLRQSLNDEEITLRELENLRNMKEANLEKIRKNKNQKQLYLSELEKSKQKLEKIISELSKKKEDVKKTSVISLLMPVNGEIINDFGYIFDKVYGTRVKNSGIDIRSPKGSPVRAAESGTVVYVGFIEGYGNIIIIDHSGFYTVYSQVVGISVKRGDRVIKGQQIAKVGEELVHFELRIGKEAVDPKPYFTSQF
ncbi:MAG: peptidoglycan DD-metalloendopeptidase family protein [candidate division WOR-3 bacterium]